MLIGVNSLLDLKTDSKDKRLVLFGASEYLRLIDRNMQDLALSENAKFIIDNDPRKNGTFFRLENGEIPVFSYERLYQEVPENLVILITSSAYAYEIFEQLDCDERLRSAKCYFLLYLITERSEVDEGLVKDWKHPVQSEAIPRILHCFWFSGEKKTELAQRCLDSWRKACPDYQIMEWNSANYDVQKNKYMRQAYEMRKWAFATDYARLDVINQYGGFYLDLDVELYEDLEPVRYHDFVIGHGHYGEVDAAVFGAKKGNQILAKLLKIYEDREFDWDKVRSGEIQPFYLIKIFRELGFALNGKYQEKNGMAIYPKEVFSDRNPYTREIKKGPYALGVHHCDGSWLEKKAFIDYEKCRGALGKIRQLYADRDKI